MIGRAKLGGVYNIYSSYASKKNDPKFWLWIQIWQGSFRSSSKILFFLKGMTLCYSGTFLKKIWDQNWRPELRICISRSGGVYGIIYSNQGRKRIKACRTTCVKSIVKKQYLFFCDTWLKTWEETLFSWRQAKKICVHLLTKNNTCCRAPILSTTDFFPPNIATGCVAKRHTVDMTQ